MAWIDYTFLCIVVVSLLIGLFRGFVREALSLATWIAAFAVALRYGPIVAEQLGSSISAPALRVALGYGLVFFGCLIAGSIMTYLCWMLVRTSGLTPVDRTLGAGFGLIRGALLVVAFVMFAGLSGLHEAPWWRASRLAPELKSSADSLQSLIPENWLAYLRPSSVTAVQTRKTER